MSTPALLFFFFYITFFLPSTLQQGTLPPKAINPERAKVMKDALSWMTFRKDGTLATDQDLEPFFQALKMNYFRSRYFRTLIVAFKDGVLPRLTLNENVDCDPAYTLEYRDPFNNSVTYAQLKKFLFKYYDNRNEKRLQFCDYRHGLVCNQQTKKCGCPKGSKMGPISEGSSVQRCQLEENEICALIDLDHDPRSKYGALKKVLPEMLFNLEKPLSCKMGTQCRFKDNTQTSPSCFNNNNGQWGKGKWGMDLGDECTLDLYAQKGPCLSHEDFSYPDYGYIGSWFGYTCYNFGALKPAVPTQVGICAHDFGSYSVTKDSYGYGNGGFGWDPMFIPLVSPATTPLRGATLRDYYKKFVDEVEDSFLEGRGNTGNTQSDFKNQSCNVAKTEEMLTHWKFFLSLEGAPPPGQDYIATEAELQNRLQKVKELTVDFHKKTCQVYKIYRGRWIKGSLKCFADAVFVDTKGNDGRCEFVPDEEDVTLAWAVKFKNFREHVVAISIEQEKENENHRSELIGHVETACDPKLGKPPGSEGAPATQSGDNDVLEGGYCPPDRRCYTNYGDYLNIYDKDCNWKDSSGEKGLFQDCQWMDEKRRLGKCEQSKLDDKIKQELKKFSSANGLGRGDTCDYDFENRIRKGIKDGGNNVDGNKYRVLWQIQNARYKDRGNGLCDRTKMLECTRQGTCKCVAGTAPRKVTFGEVKYMSNYCYQTFGDCKEDRLAKVYNAKECTKVEKEDIEKHYKAKDGYDNNGDCDGSNWCVFATDRNNDLVCTTSTTETTGFFPEEGSEEPGGGGGGGSNPACRDDPYCDYQDAGKGGNQLHDSLKMIMIIVLMTTI